MKKKALLLLFFVLLSNSNRLLAQTQPEVSKQDTATFQEYFYESLKQKAIENYDKAINALQQCQTIDPQNATIYFELGKNYLALKQYQNAYSSFEHATQIDPSNKWFWVGMYDVSYATKDYSTGIKVLDKLIVLDPKFKEDLVSLYMNTRAFDKALDLINALNEHVGSTDRREAYKLQILSEPKYQTAEIANLETQIQKYPKVESNYIALIYLYSKNNSLGKVALTVKKLEQHIPTSEWAQVSLFKNYLENNQGPKAVQAMTIVLKSTQIDSKIKHRVLNEFLLFVTKNPQYSPDLDTAISYFDHDPEINVALEIGKFYHSKKQFDKAITLYQKAIKNSNTTDLETNLLLLEAYVAVQKFEEVARQTEALLGLFPAQPQLYYYSGLAYNQLQQFQKAKDALESGQDYLIEDLPLEINFNIQLGQAYSGLGDTKKKEFYFSKANKLVTESKKQ
ncbi:tetratricopeptide repeat protein [Flavobacterium crassostreae]|uniref:Cytochrome C biosynthesis protein n=1 Tax=Flavobacterium crassostreae TaxID=1763534 RepID=A0A1B9E5P0_9FLAO|nr:tetratricopeptide repeat protein [Flavobacterium crassostreae]OCB77239.1 cytochrome C biosynthesis protein [Flavobacterium crassostreae]